MQLELASFINGAGLFLGFIWLFVLGEWGGIGKGLLLLFVSGFIIFLGLDIPIIFLRKSAQKFDAEGKRKLGLLMHWFCDVLILFILLGWCIWVFNLFSFHFNGSYISKIPWLLWSWGVSLAPWLYKAELTKGVNLRLNLYLLFAVDLMTYMILVLGIMITFGMAFEKSARIICLIAVFLGSFGFGKIKSLNDFGGPI
jgi:hypothetical protein